MPIFHAIVLGLVQGLTEFLPISSSGHLLVVPWLLDWHDFDDASTEKAFDVALHIGTLIAAIVYFRSDLVRYIGAGVRSLAPNRGARSVDERRDGKVAWLLLASTVPAAAVGALLEDTIDAELGKPVIIGVSLIVFGLLLAVADRMTGSRNVDSFNVRDAIVIGGAQALALNPGTSRSGITMTAARRMGLSRDAAARVSFLMMIPVTGGAVAFKLAGLVRDGVPNELVVPMLVGIVASGVSGWFAVWGLLRLVRTKTFTPFVAYRVAAGAFILVVAAVGWR